MHGVCRATCSGVLSVNGVNLGRPVLLVLASEEFGGRRIAMNCSLVTGLAFFLAGDRSGVRGGTTAETVRGLRLSEEYCAGSGDRSCEREFFAGERERWRFADCVEFAV